MVWSGCITSTLQHQATAMICGSVMISSAVPKQNRSKTPFSWRHPYEQAVCTMRYPPKAPTFVTRQSLPGMHTLRFFPSVSLGYGGKFFWWPVPSLAKDVRAGGAPSSVGGSVGTVAGPDLRRGFPPGPGRGIQAFSRESPDAKSRGGWPPAPPFSMVRLLPLARFGGCAALFRSWGYFEAHLRALIWGLSFAKMLFSIFYPENASQIGFGIPEEIVPLSYQGQRSPKRANESERAMKPGSRGAAPALFLPISREKWGPPPGRRGPRGAALRGCFGVAHL